MLSQISWPVWILQFKILIHSTVAALLMDSFYFAYRDVIHWLYFVDVIHGSQLEAGVGLIEGEGRKMPWKICNDAARCGTETWEPFCTCLQVTNCLRLG